MQLPQFVLTKYTLAFMFCIVICSPASAQDTYQYVNPQIQTIFDSINTNAELRHRFVFLELMDSAKTMATDSCDLGYIKYWQGYVRLTYENRHDTTLYDDINQSIALLQACSNAEAKSKIVYGYLNAARYFYFLAQYDTALQTGRQAVQLATQVGDTTLLAFAYHIMGFMYDFDDHTANFDSAIYYFNQSYILNKLYIAEPTDLGEAIEAMVIMHTRMKNWEKAYPYMREGYALAKKIEQWYLFGTMATFLAEYMEENQQYDSALHYYREAIKYASKVNDTLDISIASHQIGQLLIKQQAYDSAYYYLHNIAAHVKPKHIYYRLLLIETGICQYYRKNYADALKYLTTGLRFTEGFLNDIEMEAQIHQYMAKSYHALNKSDSAYHHMQQALEVARKEYSHKDSINKALLTEQSAELMERYETETKDQEIKQLAMSNQIKALELKESNNKILFITIVAVLCLVGLGVGLVLYRRLGQSNKLLNSLIKTRDRFFSIIAHDLKSPLINLRTFFRVFSEHADSMSQHQIASYTDEMLLELSRVDQLTHNLLSWSLNQQGGIQINKQPVDVGQVIEKNIALYSSVIKMKRIAVVNDLPAQCSLHTDANVADFVFRNLLNNALKFTPEGGQITFTAKTEHGATNVYISDTGTGLKTEIWQALLKGEPILKTQEDSRDKGTGLGLSLCIDFLKKLNSQLVLQNTSPQGTTLMVQFN